MTVQTFENTVFFVFKCFPQGKSILKRRVFRNEKRLSGRAASPRGERDDEDDCGKRYVTFDETISVKNNKDLVVKKPLKLTLVIENWKSGNATKTTLETNGTDRGIVRRLVNTIEDVSVLSTISLARFFNFFF